MDTRQYLLSKGQRIPQHAHFLHVPALFIPWYPSMAIFLYTYKIRHEAVTLAAIFFGLLSALLITLSINSWLTIFCAAALLHLRDGLDAVDGMLARMTGTGHPIGRYLDTVGDFFVIISVSLAIAYWMAPYYGIFGFFLGLAMAFSVLIQGTYWNHYNQKFLGIVEPKNQSISHKEAYHVDDELSLYTHPAAKKLLSILHTLYKIIYLWQDKWLHHIDDLSISKAQARNDLQAWYTTRWLLVAQSVFCYGTHIFIWVISLILNRPDLSIWAIIIFLNVYMVTLHTIRIVAFRQKLKFPLVTDANEKNKDKEDI